MNKTIDHNPAENSGFAQKASSALIRPAWTPVTIAMMIIGFMIYWPFGLAVIAYILWGDRLDAFKGDISRATDGAANVARNFGRNAAGMTGFGSVSNTGNAAFDEWRQGEIDRLEKERRKLDETRAEFDAHLKELRKARDREEFEAFMAAQNKRSTTTKGRGKSGSKA